MPAQLEFRDIFRWLLFPKLLLGLWIQAHFPIVIQPASHSENSFHGQSGSGRCWSVDLTNFVPYTAVFRGPLGCNWTPFSSWGYSWLFFPPDTNSQKALPPPEVEQLPSFTLLFYFLNLHRYGFEFRVYWKMVCKLTWLISQSLLSNIQTGNDYRRHLLHRIRP